jgi:hypothetical protein
MNKFKKDGDNLGVEEFKKDGDNLGVAVKKA